MGAFSIMKPTNPGGLPAPGICKSCGSSTKESYLDTGTQENDYGAILYCDECVNHFATMFGYISVEKAEEIKSLAEKQFLQNVSLHEENRSLKGAIHDLVTSGGFTTSPPIVELDLATLDSLVAGTSQRGEEPVGSGESDDAESLNVERMDDLPTDREQFRLFN